jgi:hypothetical protein
MTKQAKLVRYIPAYCGSPAWMPREDAEWYCKRETEQVKERIKRGNLKVLEARWPYIQIEKQISSCIIAKAKYALSIPNLYRGNCRTCSQGYWDETVEFLSYGLGLPESRISKAKGRTDLFRP